MIRHIVMFRLKRKLKGYSARGEGARAFPGGTRSRLSGAWRYTPERPAYRRATMDIALICDFDSIEALDVYRDHPAHVAFRRIYHAPAGAAGLL